MLERGSSASIINMASTVSSVKGAPNRCVYWRHKGGGHRLTKSVAIDFITQGIRCNAICPGTIETPSLEDRIRRPGGARRRRHRGGAPAAPLSSASRWVGLAMPRRWPHWRLPCLRRILVHHRRDPTVIDGGFTL